MIITDTALDRFWINAISVMMVTRVPALLPGIVIVTILNLIYASVSEYRRLRTEA
jgi:hypothetical protein